MILSDTEYRAHLFSLAPAIILISLGAVAMTLSVLFLCWENGYAQLILLITTAVIMAYILARNILIDGDVLRLSSTVPLAYFFFLFPNSLLLVQEFRLSSIYYFKVLQHTIPIYPGHATYALGIICLGSLAYTTGALLGGRVPQVIERVSLHTLSISWNVRPGVTFGLAATLFIVYLGTLLVLAGGPAQVIGLAIDPVARDELQSTSLTALLISLFFGFLATISIAYARTLLEGAFAARPSFVILYGLAVAMALPLANRGYVLSVALYPALIYNYLRHRIPARVVFLSALALPVIATALRLFRTSAAFSDFSLPDSFSAFFYESNMVSMLSAAMGALQVGKIDYMNGLDLVLFAFWFIPRAWWPGKYLPLDYRLTNALNISDNGRAYGSPITIFGGLHLNLTLAGMTVALLLVGYFVGRRDKQMSTSTPRGVFWRIMLFTFLVDLTRVGDVSRELSVLFLQSIMFALVVAMLRIPRSQVHGRPAYTTPVYQPAWSAHS